MSKNAVWLVGLFFALVLAAPMASAASPAKLVVTSGPPVKFLGDTLMRAPEGTLVVPGEAAPTAMTLAVEGGVIERVRVVSTYVDVAGSGLLGEQRSGVQSIPLSPTVFVLTSAAQDALLLARGPDLQLVTRSDAGAPEDVWKRASAQINVLVTEERFEPPTPTARLAQVGAPAPFHAVAFAPGTFLAAGKNGGARLDDVREFIAVDATLQDSEGRRYEARQTLVDQPGGAYVPGPAGGSWVGPGTHKEETLEYYVMHPVGGRLVLASPRLQVYASDLIIDHQGHIGFPWADGRLETGTETIRLGGDQVLLGGDLRLRPIGVGLSGIPSLTLLGDGTITYLRIGTVSRGWSEDEVALAAGGAVATVGLVAALAYFWPLLKYAASGALFPLYARVPKEQTLDHKGRELLYDLIRNEPGVSTNKLAKDVPFGWSTLTYHLRVLERNEAIVSVRDGRYKRFFDRQSGRFANGRKYVLAVLKNDATFGIARYIRAKPGSSQKEVAGSFNLSPSSVHWHVERLTEVGLVSKMREAHNVKYFPGEGWDHVTIEDLKSLDVKPAPDSAAVDAPAAAMAAPAPTPPSQPAP